MPLYEYRCKDCGHQFEKIQSFSAPEETECPVCRGPIERLISAPAIQFKGSGWYVNDYASKGSDRSMKASADGNSKSADASSADKPAAKSSESSSTSTAAPPSTPAPSSSKSE